MSLYKRLASGEHDDACLHMQPRLRSSHCTSNNNNDNNESNNLIGNIPHLRGEFDVQKTVSQQQLSPGLLREWNRIFEEAAIFTGFDEKLFGTVVTIVYRNCTSGQISAQSLTKFGLSTYLDLKLDSSSRFWPSCENLLPKYKKSHVRRALAILNLKNSSKLLNHHELMGTLPMWDETDAGNLANNMKLIQNAKPSEVGKTLLDFGLLQNHHILTFIMDVVYDSNNANEMISTENNKIVTLLGEQLDQLFDPLLEYSPEVMEITYTPATLSASGNASGNGNGNGNKNMHPKEKALLYANSKVQNIVDEFVNVQTKFTMGLVELLQNFIIPLRISATELNSKATNRIAEINRIFPPTIDEMARINCIFNDALLKARKINYVEVFNAIGTIIPYFYKPCIRHEANMKSFYAKLKGFYQDNKKSVFDNERINRSRYAVTEIDTIVTGSLMMLPKLKLIMNRLYEEIKIEAAKETNQANEVYIDIGNKNVDTAMGFIEKQFRSAMEVFQALGNVEGAPLGEIGRERIFTPTGKILTELANNWPAELQYGWLTRKVIGICELIPISPNMNDSETLHYREVLVVFSDHLLFIQVQKPEDVVSENKEWTRQNSISVADALLHSLVNEKPLPNLDSFPTMTVSCWCSIDDAIVSQYYSLGTNGAQQDCVQFLNHTKNGFKTLNMGQPEYSRHYHTVDRSGNDIVDLVTRAKILEKTTAFHLFKSPCHNGYEKIYYTAHDSVSYGAETLRSPFVVFLNVDTDVLAYCQSHSHIQLALQFKLTENDKVEVFGYGKYGKVHIDEIVSVSNLSSFVMDVLVSTVGRIFCTYSAITRCLIKGNSNDLRRISEGWVGKLETANAVNPIATIERPISPPEAERNSTNVPTAAVNTATKGVPTVTNTSTTVDADENTGRSLAKQGNKSLSKKKSLVNRLFKKNHSPKNSQRIKTTLSTNTMSSKATSASRNLPNTFIPQGNKTEYKHVFQPVPILEERADSISSVIINKGNNDVYRNEQEAYHENKHMRETSGGFELELNFYPSDDHKVHQPMPSIEVHLNFQFPMDKHITHTTPIRTTVTKPAVAKSADVKHATSSSGAKLDTETIPSNCTIKRISTFDDLAIVPKRSTKRPLLCMSMLQDYDYGAHGNTGLSINTNCENMESEPNWVIAMSRENSLRLNNEVRKLSQQLINPIEDIIEFDETTMNQATRNDVDNGEIEEEEEKEEKEEQEEEQDGEGRDVDERDVDDINAYIADVNLLKKVRKVNVDTNRHSQATYTTAAESSIFDYCGRDAGAATHKGTQLPHKTSTVSLISLDHHSSTMSGEEIPSTSSMEIITNIDHLPNLHPPRFMDSKYAKSRIKRDISSVSVTPSAFASDLGKLMDIEFSNGFIKQGTIVRKVTGPKLIPYSIPTKNKNCEHTLVKPKFSSEPNWQNVSVESRTSSASNVSEKFFSPSLEENSQLPRTLVEEELNQEKQEVMKGQAASFEKTKPISDSMRDESIAQLSQLLEQSVNFEDFQVESLLST
ncbi:hypothetical protein LELG_05560 [Lodderomyces elongisporus NRRL YB-4239]|uniref:Uncharacterized protein n=1 Tax=Lodderomyces elongisporus (strain ATCC 11503 / CBS 2605 / JCM 1781 / NBRC 1676 / NRRL YB-4239) TaxID=379508 RepID=A5E7H1_LODEL|nr:hypothetical protein LELG_05560 [Lodderomyces elongisporus NRRL YB-4239]